MKLRQLIRAAILLCALAAANASGQETRKAISKPPPRYPEIAKRMNLVGAVKVEIVIGPDGKIKNTNVIGGHPILIGATLDALKAWKYEPAKTETAVTLTSTSVREEGADNFQRPVSATPFRLPCFYP